MCPYCSVTVTREWPNTAFKPGLQHSRAYELEILVDGSGYLNGLQSGV